MSTNYKVKNLALCDSDEHVQWRACIKINGRLKDVKDPLAMTTLSASEEAGLALVFQNDC